MFQIRPATLEDVPCLRALAERIWRAYYPAIITPAQIDYMLPRMYAPEVIEAELGAGVGWAVALLKDTPVGFLSYGLDVASREVKLHKLYLLTELHGQGHGRAMLEHVRAAAERLGAARIHLQVNKRNEKAIRAYQRAGFRVARSVVADIGGGFVMDDFIMVLENFFPGASPLLGSDRVMINKQQLWQRFQERYTEFPSLGLALDLSRVDFPQDYWQQQEAALQKAFAAMTELEKGAIANPDEKRMVGHYWLRNAALAPNPQIRGEIETTLAAIKTFADEVHSGKTAGARGPFKNLLVIGIGGSALGPQFVAHALGQPGKDKLRPFFFDNTDPDGMDKAFAQLDGQLGQTLAVVISKSGGTPETRNGMLEAAAAWERAGLKFNAHAVAVTSAGSALDKHATQQGWLRRFPMWDWVGGRTSETSAVGLLPAALQGLDIDGMLAGARACDEVTRQAVTAQNPSAQLALAWHFLTEGRGSKDMVVLPYKDRLELISRYLQQLVMESLGKEFDLTGKIVNQGITVYGNKGSTDQHAYIQQLREGVLNFFAVFVEVLRDRAGASLDVEPGVTSGDYLSGFFLGTREALYEKGRQSVTLTIREVNATAIGMLIALFERAVGLYATLVNINAYHQPGVEAGKKAAGAVLALQGRVLAYLREKRGHALTAAQIASGMGAHHEDETVFKICEHLAANPERGVARTAGKSPADISYRIG